MIQYGLGLEYRKTGDLENAAQAFSAAARLDPGNTAAFQELGSALVALGRSDDARAIFAEGILAAERVGALRARDHIRRLLDNLGPSTQSFCS